MVAFGRSLPDFLSAWFSRPRLKPTWQLFNWSKPRAILCIVSELSFIAWMHHFVVDSSVCLYLGPKITFYIINISSHDTLLLVLYNIPVLQTSCATMHLYRLPRWCVKTQFPRSTHLTMCLYSNTSF